MMSCQANCWTNKSFVTLQFEPWTPISKLHDVSTSLPFAGSHQNLIVNKYKTISINILVGLHATVCAFLCQSIFITARRLFDFHCFTRLVKAVIWLSQWKSSHRKKKLLCCSDACVAWESRAKHELYVIEHCYEIHDTFSLSLEIFFERSSFYTWKIFIAISVLKFSLTWKQ